MDVVGLFSPGLFGVIFSLFFSTDYLVIELLKFSFLVLALNLLGVPPIDCLGVLKEEAALVVPILVYGREVTAAPTLPAGFDFSSTST